mmetsp:Transcript_14612/g.22242  ORF Transcript_14612/g.22242 Transcript_14612/m.22242 type:complete len:236 (+) Transcript_14612:206-913(+)
MSKGGRIELVPQGLSYNNVGKHELRLCNGHIGGLYDVGNTQNRSIRKLFFESLASQIERFYSQRKILVYLVLIEHYPFQACRFFQSHESPINMGMVFRFWIKVSSKGHIFCSLSQHHLLGLSTTDKQVLHTLLHVRWKTYVNVVGICFVYLNFGGDHLHSLLLAKKVKVHAKLFELFRWICVCNVAGEHAVERIGFVNSENARCISLDDFIGSADNCRSKGIIDIKVDFHGLVHF